MSEPFPNTLRKMTDEELFALVERRRRPVEPVVDPEEARKTRDWLEGMRQEMQQTETRAAQQVSDDDRFVSFNLLLDFAADIGGETGKELAEFRRDIRALKDEVATLKTQQAVTRAIADGSIGSIKTIEGRAHVEKTG